MYDQTIPRTRTNGIKAFEIVVVETQQQQTVILSHARLSCRCTASSHEWHKMSKAQVWHTCKALSLMRASMVSVPTAVRSAVTSIGVPPAVGVVFSKSSPADAGDSPSAPLSPARSTHSVPSFTGTFCCRPPLLCASVSTRTVPSRGAPAVPFAAPFAISAPDPSSATGGLDPGSSYRSFAVVVPSGSSISTSDPAPVPASAHDSPVPLYP
eukprot:8268270-Pyramimonas_sp.AAC.1